MTFENLNDFRKTGQSLGEGGFSKVYIIKEVSTGHKYAAKELKPNIYSRKDDQIRLLREINIINKLNHPAIVKFKGFSFTSIRDEHNQISWQPTIVTEIIEKVHYYIDCNKKVLV